MIATHIIIGAYGFWLPNDPRGSQSDYVGSKALLPFGNATGNGDRESVAAMKHDHALRLAAKDKLEHPPVLFSGVQARAIGQGFAVRVARSKMIVFACAIMPDHLHLVIAVHRFAPKMLSNLLKGAATRQLVREQLHPFQSLDPRPKCFARDEWIVFLDTADDVRRAIAYVEANPEKEGKPRQRWKFVTPFMG